MPRPPNLTTRIVALEAQAASQALALKRIEEGQERIERWLWRLAIGSFVVTGTGFGASVASAFSG